MLILQSLYMSCFLYVADVSRHKRYVSYPIKGFLTFTLQRMPNTVRKWVAESSFAWCAGSTWYPCICWVPRGCEHTDRHVAQTVVQVLAHMNTAHWLEYEYLGGGGTVNWPCPSVTDATEIVTVFNLLPAVHSYHFFSEVVSFNSFPLATQV